MFEIGNLVYLLVALLILSGVFFLVRQLRPEERARRRRDRNHGRIVSKLSRPTISLAVKTKPEVSSEEK